MFTSQCRGGGGHPTLVLVVLAVAVALLAAGSIHAAPYIRDDLADTGTEPNPAAVPMYLSPDIWVRNSPLPGWNPYPYPFASPPAWVVSTHFNPDYASPASGKPNYVYVRVRNRGTASTAGTERLLLYVARASTGLSWDPAKVAGSFIDNVQAGAVLGMEITKVRKNAATATQAERDAYREALLKIATDLALVFAPSNTSYWRTQQEIHRFGPTYRHGIPSPAGWVPAVAFLPWHREYINRFEGLLQEADPKVKLLYWQWTQNPTNAAFLDYSVNFMGSFGSGSPATAVPIGAPLFPALNGGYPYFGPGGSTTATRRLQETGTPPAADTTNVNRVPYDAAAANTAFSGGLESSSHNNSHVYIASQTNAPDDPAASLAIRIANLRTAGDQAWQTYAARDPFFFLLHGKVDELWARWQRKTLANLDPATTYGTASANATITGAMGPWDGTVVGDTLWNNVSTLGIDPWTAAGGQIYAKPANDRSVTSPPFYDTAPLTIPQLQPGEEVIIEIPWFPPNPVVAGVTHDHVCLIARIETSTTTPFGMTVAETTNIDSNTRQNNKIAWRNVSIVDSIPGPFKLASLRMENGFGEPLQAGLLFGAVLGDTGGGFLELGTVRVNLGRELFERWKAGGERSQGVKSLGDGQFRLARPGATLEGIELKPGESVPFQIFFELKKDYRPTKRDERIVYDIVQTGTPRDPKAAVGGQRYEISTEKLTILERGRVWRWMSSERKTPARWTGVDFDDTEWHERKLNLGWVEPPHAGGHASRGAAVYFFRRAFDVVEPGFYRDLQLRIRRSDAAAVYLNDKEVYRFNLPEGATSAWMLARAPVVGLERMAYFPVKLDPSLLRAGRNVLAVAIHRADKNQGPLTFDAEIVANTGSAREAPLTGFTNVVDGTLLTVGRVATISADAFKPEGAIRSATLFVDEKPVQTLKEPPYDFKWSVQPGPHRMRLSVADSDQMQSSTFATVTGVKNVPPVVEITQPGQHTEINAGDVLVAVAQAQDPDGKIARVDFFVHDSYQIGAPGRRVGSVRQPPYIVTVRGLKPGHAMVTAVAFDNGRQRTAAIPIMVLVKEKGVPGEHPHR